MQDWTTLKTDPALIRLGELEHDVAPRAARAGLSAADWPALADQDWAERLFRRLSAEYSIMVIGQVSTGKSSFINSLIGRRLLAPASQPTDGVVSVMMEARPPSGEAAQRVQKDGTVESFASVEEGLSFLRQQDTDSDRQLACREVHLYLEEASLRRLRVINTPGLGDRLQQYEEATLQYLRADESDLIIWTFHPDHAVNEEEIGLLRRELSRRRGAVLGVVTCALEDREDDLDYLPTEDPELVGPAGVVAQIRRHVGDYLADVIVYDSVEALAVAAELRAEPGVQDSEAMLHRKRRSGIEALQRELVARLGPDKGDVERGRVRSVLERAQARATALADVARASAERFQSQSDESKEWLAAWEKWRSDVERPAKMRLSDETAKLASARATHASTLMSSAASATIERKFKLGETMWRALAGWTPWVDKMADKINVAVESAVAEALTKHEFSTNLENAFMRLVTGALDELESEMVSAGAARGEGTDGVLVARGDIAVDGTVDDAFRGALAAAMKPVFAKLVSEAARKFGAAPTKKAATKAAQQAAKQAGFKTAGGTLGKLASGFLLVLAPFDIAKLVKDFGTGRKKLAEHVKKHYEAQQPILAMQLEDSLHSAVDKIWVDLLSEARTAGDDRTKGSREMSRMAQELEAAADELERLSAGLAARAAAP